MPLYEWGDRIFSFAHLANFWFRFLVFAHKILRSRFFGFVVLRGLRVFSNLIFGSRFLSRMPVVFYFYFSVHCIQYGFSGFAN